MWFVRALLMLCLIHQAAAQRPGDETVPVTPPVSGNLYVDGWEIRKEIVIKPLALDAVMDLGFSEFEKVMPERREELKPKILTFLADRFEVTIDGETGGFTAEGLRYIEPEPGEEISLIDGDRAVLPWGFLISASYVKPLPAVDSEIAFEWHLFPEDMNAVAVNVATPNGSEVLRITPRSGRTDAEVELSSDMRAAPKPPPAPARTGFPLPWLSILLGMATVVLVTKKRRPAAAACAGLAVAAGFWIRPVVPFPGGRDDALGEKDAAVIAERLLDGVYHAFQFREEERQYDLLSEVLAGDALSETYLEARRTRETRDREGSRVRVDEVTVEDAAPEPLPDARGFAAFCRWKTAGEVGHWGHFHERLNLYEADLRVEVVDGRWKATRFTLKNRERE